MQQVNFTTYLLHNMVKLYPFILQKLLARTHSLMRAEDHLGNKKPSASHKFCKLLSKRKKSNY